MAYTIGVDFGTLSGRAVLVNVRTGEEIASAVKEYTHAVIDRTLPKTGEKLLGTGRFSILPIISKFWKRRFRTCFKRRALIQKT